MTVLGRNGEGVKGTKGEEVSVGKGERGGKGYHWKENEGDLLEDK